MTLPAACPAKDCASFVRLDRCWRSVPLATGGRHHCGNSVDPADTLGLCDTHRQELSE